MMDDYIIRIRVPESKHYLHKLIEHYLAIGFEESDRKNWYIEFVWIGESEKEFDLKLREIVKR